MTPTFSIRRVEPNESEETFSQVAQIHQKVIDTGFLSTLGHKFLVVLYRTIARSESSFLLIAETQGKVLGFICGAMSTGKVYKDFARHSGFMACRILLPKLFSYKRIKRIVETLLYPSRHQEAALPEPEILNFCVDVSLQRQGVGKALFFALCDEFSRRGVEKIRIVTGQSQTKAQQFYERLGAVKYKNLSIHEGVESLVYIFTIPSEKPQYKH